MDVPAEWHAHEEGEGGSVEGGAGTCELEEAGTRMNARDGESE